MNIGIVGLGLIGSSLALKLAEIYNDVNIYGEDISKSNLNYAIENRIIDNRLEEKHYSELNILFLAIPVDQILDISVNILDKTNNKTLVVDLGSTKKPICDLIKDNINRSRFLAAHPIAGTEFSGPITADNNLFNNKTIILCETEKTDNKLLIIAKELFLSMEMQIKEMNADEHDKHIDFPWPHKAAILPDSFATCANVSNLAKLLEKLVIAILLGIFLIIFIRLSFSLSSEPEWPSTLELVESLTIANTPFFPKDFIFS